MVASLKCGHVSCVRWSRRAFNNTAGTVQQADASATALAVGDPQAGLHETMIAVEKADIAFRAFTAVKNRAVEAYREVMRMQI